MLLSCAKFQIWGFLDGPVVKNPPASAENMSLIPAPEDPTCPRASKPMRHNY